MSKIIAVHSYKGGTGKTLLSMNLAAAFAKIGKKVCLFDLDFRAPSLATILKVKESKFWLNDYLNGKCEIDDVIIDLSTRLNSEGKFYVGLANPSTEGIRDMSGKDRKWEMRALGRLLWLRTALLKEKNFDYIVFDTSPGLQYSSINGIVASDYVIVATTGDRSDVDGTQRMLSELYNLFEKKSGIVLNKVLDSVSKANIKDLQSKIKDVYQVPLLGFVPCYCEILRAKGNYIFAQDKPDHPFTKTLTQLIHKIEADEI